ncbi:MAG: UDP-N-acetylglucosamine 1-carboxyvinyltransferase [Candidatus Doudnabacteria bacterium RIFCSPLOWO2_02_FULL_42_9]|uniref:UDP-N-acetylglucosamine 1-carboxyvinyltransferase n=1 Tax=Candidatus Doudnabacteria bacterium RIFCSPHIGHO2_01_FULL_41_86 TaxID=1817821 RepID=A0A1F5N9S8_9BACT|nr:MAG: UDP-N-acetylglucosamine 1-carboxyvinyltransferase [Candidatus Doudnabacteria bacterium RIFCSPHIGHO2_01_FULL_41_86]OGE75054.1 MAG: UDP-N-acetylglucosamine 1-carboxyvinyltransferase [Candidatus Doudnabacteria bacterium RIFCSPHIGHO2_01_43_10]OGE85239.1 MAG: UDP-N-acetylglucosamine 1-carboxyvinyltransferase [Candidatus Doudnabacteria bacterium RIFCSPHIGHO2_12_FULL_42_22]OGE86777.1 MAG: UDP-N-acetylglucosamine 1-carboxyvinyltransferase [Candidatus Doudnabacteria bacterium RIFCSPHIGHO2_02_FULL
MAKFIINGGKKLSGEIKVSGSKNALFPIFAASLLTEQPCRISNVPEIVDKQVMVHLLADLGVQMNVSPHEVLITAANINKTDLNPELTSKLRGSVVLLGALLARMKRVTMSFPGGDSIGKRPIDSHLQAFEALGAITQANGVIEISAEKLVGNKIILEESSVTATENAILAGAMAEGQTVIKLAAMEPHVQQLCEFLNKMGAKITGIGTTTINITGVPKLHGAEIDLIPDSNEAASFITLAAATKSTVTVTGINPEYLDDFLLKLKNMAVNFEVGKDFIEVNAPTVDYQAIKIQGGLYPKLASDDIPAMAILATQAVGKSTMNEWMYENRLGYATELMKMGASVEAVDSHNVIFTGPTPLKGDKMTSSDIRMGITLVIAALVAQGQSEIEGVEHIDRGYENLEERLSKLGAEIRRA